MVIESNDIHRTLDSNHEDPYISMDEGLLMTNAWLSNDTKEIIVLDSLLDASPLEPSANLSGMISVAQKTEGELHLEDEYVKRLQSALEAKEAQCLAYGEHINELEQRLSGEATKCSMMTITMPAPDDYDMKATIMIGTLLCPLEPKFMNGCELAIEEENLRIDGSKEDLIFTSFYESPQDSQAQGKEGLIAEIAMRVTTTNVVTHSNTNDLASVFSVLGDNTIVPGTLINHEAWHKRKEEAIMRRERQLRKEDEERTKVFAKLKELDQRNFDFELYFKEDKGWGHHPSPYWGRSLGPWHCGRFKVDTGQQCDWRHSHSISVL